MVCYGSAELRVYVDRPLLVEVIRGRHYYMIAVAHIADLADGMPTDHIANGRSQRQQMLSNYSLMVYLGTRHPLVLLDQMEIVRYQARYCLLEHRNPWRALVM